MKQSVEADPWAVGWVVRGLVLVTFLAAFAVPVGLLPIVAIAPDPSGELAPAESLIVIQLGTPVPTPTPTPEFTPTPHIPRIGIIAGHAGSDSGAVCPDGLKEVDINLAIAEQVVMLLAGYGWHVDQFEEFDVRLNGYRADALLSIHADSCNVPGKTGFKVARAEASYIPAPEDRLVTCLSDHYSRITGLAFDEHTITYDMTRYHAFYEIHANTPAAVIEAGFMLDDRELLTERPEVVANGIVAGLACFIAGESR
jgi:N-acetylmuramoyl-L-alanine amidase